MIGHTADGVVRGCSDDDEHDRIESCEDHDEEGFVLVVVRDPRESQRAAEGEGVGWDGIVWQISVSLSGPGTVFGKDLHCPSHPVQPNALTSVGMKYCIVCDPVIRAYINVNAHTFQSRTVIFSAAHSLICSSVPCVAPIPS